MCMCACSISMNTALPPRPAMAETMDFAAMLQASAEEARGAASAAPAAPADTRPINFGDMLGAASAAPAAPAEARPAPCFGDMMKAASAASAAQGPNAAHEPLAAASAAALARTGLSAVVAAASAVPTDATLPDSAALAGEDSAIVAAAAAPSPAASAGSEFDQGLLAKYSISEDMAIAVSEAAVVGDLDLRLRNRLYKRISRMAEKCELPQALAAEWASSKEDRTGAKQLSFIKLWLSDPTFGGATVAETASAGTDHKNRFVWGWVTKADLRAKYSGLPDVDELVEAEVKGAKWLPHPADKKNQDRRMYRVVVRVEEEQVGVHSTRTSVSASASADKEAVEFAMAVTDEQRRRQATITRAPTPGSPVKKKHRALERHESASADADADADAEGAREPKKPRTVTAAGASVRMKNMVHRDTQKIEAIIKDAVSTGGAVVDEYVGRLQQFVADNTKLLEDCAREKLPSDAEGLASAVQRVQAEVKSHTGVIGLLKKHLQLTRK